MWNNSRQHFKQQHRFLGSCALMTDVVSGQQLVGLSRGEESYSHLPDYRIHLPAAGLQLILQLFNLNSNGCREAYNIKQMP